ncbi:hypothetical protein [Marinobacter mobilis]|uniref:Uncharacterized protein n=1 Tax=Marinobacter mobilis TaxID=488533 RepID=A0A1H2SBR3_9GAMM|nr:hypothetical protein [Marinobacter mobilis]SDW28948.1 hypothetical protein SAMN04487960_10283 [Marinobacter mobilis]
MDKTSSFSDMDDYLKPELGPSTIAEPVTYQSLYILDTLLPDTSAAQPEGDVSIPQQGPFDPFAECGNQPEKNIAFGVLLKHHQSWQQKGLALGNLLHSVCLAPGEVTQVAIMDWTRRTRGSSTQDTKQGELVSADIDQSRAVNEVQKAVAEEAQAGQSKITSSSSSAQTGVSGGGLLFSVTASGASSHSTALTAQFSTGKRDLAAESSNQLNQRTAETSQSLRSRRSSVVKEVTESEAENMTTRVLANYNHRHTLNIEYFELLQTYAITTRLDAWDRCIFLPMQVLDFSDINVVRQQLPALIHLFQQYPDLEPRIEELKALADPDFKAPQSTKQKLAEQEYARLQQELAATQTAFDNRDTIVKEVHLLEQTLNIVDDTAFKKAATQAITTLGRLLADEPVAQSYLETIKTVLPNKGDFDSTVQNFRDLQTEQAGNLRQQVKELTRKVEAERKKMGIFFVPIQDFLIKHSLILSQKIWLQLDTYRIYLLLQGIKLDGRALSSLVDPSPVGLFGNYLAFRWGFTDTESDDAKHPARMSRTTFMKTFISPSESAASPDSPEIAVPTSGVFAEAVLGRSNAAETIDETKFWRWKEEPIPILPPKINPLNSRDRAKGMDLTPGDFAAAIAQLRSQPVGDISHIGQILGALQKNDMFRNMAGLQEAATLAGQMAQISGDGATAAGQRSAEIYGKILKTFEDVLDSEAGQAMVADFMLPGSGEALQAAKGLEKSVTGGKGSGNGRDHELDQTPSPGHMDGSAT